LDAYKSIIFIKYRLPEEAPAVLNSLINQEMRDGNDSIIFT